MADMTRDEMADDYKRLKREYTLLHQDYRRAEGRLLRERERIIKDLEEMTVSDDALKGWNAENSIGFRQAIRQAIKIVKGE